LDNILKNITKKNYNVVFVIAILTSGYITDVLKDILGKVAKKILKKAHIILCVQIVKDINIE